MDVSSLAQLELVIKKALAESLKNEVKQGAIECGKEHVDVDVYDAYQSQYDRTGELRERFEGEMLNDSTLQITNTRQDGDRDIVDTIEYGRNYYTPELDAKIGARPFMERTKEELDESGLARELLIKGLAKTFGSGNVF